MKEIKISNKDNNKKIIYYMKENFPNLSSAILYKTLRNKDIKVNGKRTNDSNYILKQNDTLQIYIDEYVLYGFPKELLIEYEDDNLLVAYKPQGILSNNEEAFQTEPTFEDFVKSQKGENIKICHRLDRNTTGLTLFAKNKQSEQILFDKFKNHEIEKHYICKVYGIPQKKHAILNDYLFKDTKKSMVYISSTHKKGYQNIITEYFVLSSNKSDNTSILEVILHTGRTHQIRAHLAFIGYPIIGDGKYGRNDINKKFKCKTQNLCSYKMKFKFNESAQQLNYLNGKEFEKTNIQF